MNAETLPIVFPDDSPRARRTDPETSHAAADMADTAGSRIAVLTVLRASRRPLADFEIARAWAQRLEATRRFGTVAYTDSRLRTARAELVGSGAVIPDGETRTPSGRRSQTWRTV